MCEISWSVETILGWRRCDLSISLLSLSTRVAFVFVRQQQEKSVVTRKKEQRNRWLEMSCFVSEALLCASLKKTTANLE